MPVRYICSVCGTVLAEITFPDGHLTSVFYFPRATVRKHLHPLSYVDVRKAFNDRCPYCGHWFQDEPEIIIK